MKILFSLDVKLIKKNKNYYTTGAADYSYFLSHQFNSNDSIDIICREDLNKNNTGSFSISSGKYLTFHTVKNYFELFSSKNKKKIIDKIKNCDICFVKLPTIIGCFVCHYCNKYKKKYIVEMVGDPYDSLIYKGDIKSKILAPIIKYFNKKYIKSASSVIYVSKKFLQKKYPTDGKEYFLSDVKIKKCPDEIIKSRKNRLKKYNSSYNFKFGIIGSLNVKYKGLETALCAISRLKDDFPNVQLRIIGTGNKDYWIKMINNLSIEENVIFEGAIEHEKIFNWYDDLDFFLMPSLTEGMPRSLLEAMSRGCLCIASNVGGIPEILNQEMIIYPKDYKKICSLFNKIIENNTFAINMIDSNIINSDEFIIEKLNLKKNKMLEEMKGRLK